MQQASQRNKILIGAILALHILLPLSYYTFRSDIFDERFAWRMFSDVRQMKCRASAFREDAAGRKTRLAPHQDIQVAWFNLMKRNRAPVIEKYLSRMCEKDDAEKAFVTTQCARVRDAKRISRRYIRSCESGDFLVEKESK